MFESFLEEFHPKDIENQMKVLESQVMNLGPAIKPILLRQILDLTNQFGEKTDMLISNKIFINKLFSNLAYSPKIVISIILNLSSCSQYIEPMLKTQDDWLVYFEQLIQTPDKYYSIIIYILANLTSNQQCCEIIVRHYALINAIFQSQHYFKYLDEANDLLLQFVILSSEEIRNQLIHAYNVFERITNHTEWKSNKPWIMQKLLNALLIVSKSNTVRITRDLFQHIERIIRTVEWDPQLELQGKFGKLEQMERTKQN